MLINDGRILANGTGGTLNIFRAQVIDSYIQINSPSNNSIIFTLSGVSANNPLNIYYKTLASTIKNAYASNGYNSQYFLGTGENSYKPFYFSGNLNALINIEFYNQFFYSSTYVGDLVKLINQFPNLRSFILNHISNNYYNYSTFNQDISNTEFPLNLSTFHIADSTLSGNINTITNFNNVSDLELISAQFTGSLNSGFTHLSKLSLISLNYLNGNLNTIITNNPNLNRINISDVIQLSGNASTLDVSKLNYMYLYLWNMPQIIGNVDNWTFNTGLTSLQLYDRYIDGDMTNWNFTNTKLDSLLIYGNQNNFPFNSKLYGNLSGWTFPSTLQSFQLYFISGITSIPLNYTGCTNFSSITIYAIPNINQSINDFKFNNNIQTIYFYNNSVKSKLHGNISTFIIPPSATTIVFLNASITGNISLILFNTKITLLELNNNYLNGDIINMTIPDSLTDFSVAGNSGVTLNLSSTPYTSGKTAGVFHTKNINQFNISNISGITGNLSNLVIDNTIYSFYIYGNSNFHCDLLNLDISKIQYFNATNCPNLFGDLSNWLTGTTLVSQLDLSQDGSLSGSTTNWNANIPTLKIENTNLGGKLKINNVYWLSAYNTHITSNIATDFNFSGQGYWVDLNGCINLTGNLSGVTLCHSQYIFYINGCTGILGSNAFINYLFLNKKNWTSNYLGIDIANIGDSVTGATETSGSTGTWSGNIMDLSETQVNNLAAGLDYTGLGSNTPWDSKQKIWWMKYAQISSTNPSLRYIQIAISY
jgi:hypothetical protein